MDLTDIACSTGSGVARSVRQELQCHLLGLLRLGGCCARFGLSKISTRLCRCKRALKVADVLVQNQGLVFVSAAVCCQPYRTCSWRGR
jgi:hypothetical protein